MAREDSGSGASGGLKVVGVTNFRDPQGVRTYLFAIHETWYIQVTVSFNKSLKHSVALSRLRLRNTTN